MIDGQVPWRCLVPADAVAFIIGKGGANIRELSETSGARVAISKEGETPSTLADKVVTISGLVEQKESACGQVLKKLRQMQGVNDHEPGVFVIIVPQISAPVIIGSKGAQIKAIMEQSGAEINVGREAIIGMPDQPISINGTQEQVVSAVSKLNGVLQDMADRGKLMDKDFVYRSHEAGSPDLGGMGDLPPPGPLPPAHAEPRATPAAPTVNGGAPHEVPSHGPSASACGGLGPLGPGGAQAAPAPPAQTTAATSFGAAGTSAQVAAATSFGAAGCPAQAAAGTSFGAASPPAQAAAATSFGATGAPSSASGAGPHNFGSQPSGGGGFGPGSQPSAGGGFGPGSLAASAPGAGPGGQGCQGCQAMSFGGSPGQAVSSAQTGGQTSFGPGTTNGFSSQGATSFGPGGASFMPNGPSSFGGAGMGMGGMGMGGMGMGGPMGMHGMGLGGMGMNGPMGMGMGAGMGMNGMGGLGNPMMGTMGMGGPMMGGMGGSSNERAFMAALQASGINSAQLTLLLPQSLVQNILVPRGMMAEIAQRSGAQIDLGNESPPGMRQVTLSGTMVANALASLFLQERVIQLQQML